MLELKNLKFKKPKSGAGFTLVESLVIIAFFGLLLSIVIVILGSLRFQDRDIQQLHDVRKISDVNQLRTGLELFFSNAGGYPDSHLWFTGKVIGCSTSKILKVPKSFDLENSLYLYESKGTWAISKTCETKVWSEYSLQFDTESKSYLGPSGTYCLSPEKGIISGKCL